MNTKKIWMMAIVFGVIMASIFSIVTTKKGNTIEPEEDPLPNSEELVETEPKPNNNKTNTFYIEAGKRAMSIGVNEVQSVSGFVYPGSFVDIIAVLPTEPGGKINSQIILKDVRVLAVGKNIDVENVENTEPYQMVTLEINPQDGPTLLLAKEAGSITLMLKGNE